VYGGEQKASRTLDAIHDRVHRRFAREIERGTVVVHRARSIEVAPMLEPLDRVYVDGNHRYEGVKDDLTAYYPLVRPGGVVAGDDYGLRGWWGDGITEAVDQFVGSHGCELKIMGHQFLIRKPVQRSCG
jgi:Methyltransferase domain